MRTMLVLSALILGTACGEPGAPVEAEVSFVGFPEVKPVCDLPDRLTWAFMDGPDFYVYRTTDTSEENTAGIGIYFGHHPNRHLAEPADLRPGVVAGNAVTWRLGEGFGDLPSKLFMETIFVYPPHNTGSDARHALWIHVWVYAATESQMDKLVKALETLEFLELPGRDAHSEAGPAEEDLP